MNGTNNTTVDLNSTAKATALTINASQTIDLNGANILTLSSATNAGNLIGNSGTLLLTFAGVAFTNTGTFTYNTSTVRYTGTGATIAALSASGRDQWLLQPGAEIRRRCGPGSGGGHVRC